MGSVKTIRTTLMVFASYVCGAAWLVVSLGLSYLFFGALWKSQSLGLIFALVVSVAAFFAASRLYVSLRTNRRSLATGFFAFSIVFIGLMLFFVKNPDKVSALRTALAIKTDVK